MTDSMTESAFAPINEQTESDFNAAVDAYFKHLTRLDYAAMPIQPSRHDSLTDGQVVQLRSVNGFLANYDIASEQISD